MTTRIPHPSRGSALVTVILLTTVLCTLVASILGLALAERRLNHRDELRLEARYAAEAVAEYGISQIRQKYATRSDINLRPGGSDALKAPPASFWKGSNVVTSSIEIIGGTPNDVTTGASALYFVSPDDPANANDPHVGKWVLRRDVPVIAKATIKPRNGGPAITSYVLEKLSVRAVPPFQHAIFSNMDMEIFPGPEMNIYGPVHVNGNLFCSSQGSQLNFRGRVTVAGNVYHAWKNTDGRTQGTGYEGLGGSPVHFLNKKGDLIALKGDYTFKNEKGEMETVTQWNDSSMGGSSKTPPSLLADNDFRDFATDTWNGNLQTSAHGIETDNPHAIGSYEEDTNTTNGIDESNNAARQLIEPSNWPSDSDANYVTKREVERKKYANNAGLYLTVNPSTGKITAVSRSKKSATPTKTLTSLPAGLVQWKPYSLSKTNVVTSGMYDKRREKGTNLVEIDMGKLKAAVTEMTKDADDRNSSAIGGLETSDWTGIVYVEIEGGPTTNGKDTTSSDVEGTTNAATNAQALTTAVRLVNGTGPVASYGKTGSPGLTIATNGPLYVKGNYNADGKIQDTTATNPSESSANKAETGEVPAALVADAITILSANFSDANSRQYTNPTATTSTIEIAAAMLMGSTPTDKNDSNKSSGGIHNFPRFIENWDSKQVWIRGSLVSLFESRVATEPWHTGYYSPPKRCWGFSSLFRDGHNPPGSIDFDNFRRTSFTDLTEAQYNTIKSSYSWED